MNIASFFSGCGGMDLGFEKAGFNVEFANDNASQVWATFEKNFPNTRLSKVSIKKVNPNDVPNTCGIVGGPPCQSWSNAGSGRGIMDYRGMLFFDYINMIRQKQPLFFVAENVEGLLADRNANAYNMILQNMQEAGYNVTVQLVNAADFGVPQKRKRIFFIGYRDDLDIFFNFPTANQRRVNVKDAIYDLCNSALPAKPLNLTNGSRCNFLNHEYWEGGFSYIFLSRNRVLNWDSQSFTIQASGRQTSLHPQAPEMVKIEKDVRILKPGYEDLYRRLSVRECARLQTFPDDFEFIYSNLNAGYKMIGNSVPVKLSQVIAERICSDFIEINIHNWFPRFEEQAAIC
ncbi:DNA cytosine methyltransferase [Pedobacter frigiditerrae]|uniref:DNA cytosine methyltransferase n=1 Tax=Pedobacter frigiditerrae TaxID=2530452 RepID=UPI00292DEAD9|nr:DNA cytosine methyltransferase [Pedobacter frigiditerrae]